MTDDYKARIDAMDVEQMLRQWRFAAPGFFPREDAATDYFIARMRQLKEEDPRAYTLASKEIGW